MRPVIPIAGGPEILFDDQADPLRALLRHEFAAHGQIENEAAQAGTGSDEGGRRAAALYTLIETAKLNDIDPHTWLADVLARMPDHPAKRINEFFPWNWKTPAHAAAA